MSEREDEAEEEIVTAVVPRARPLVPESQVRQGWKTLNYHPPCHKANSKWDAGHVMFQLPTQ